MSLRKTKKYEIALKIVRSFGLKVRHINSKKFNGLFKDKDCSIYISNDVKGTITGCFTLFHELGHYRQIFLKRYKIFVEEDFHNDKSDIKYIIRGEQDASKFALKCMKLLKLRYKSADLDKNQLSEYIDFWRKEYFI